MAKGTKYTPIAKRQERPSAIKWLLKEFPAITDNEICRLIRTTKNTVDSIRNKKYWNSSSLSPKDPVVFNFCSQADIMSAVDKANRKIARKKKEVKKENQNIEG